MAVLEDLELSDTELSEGDSSPVVRIGGLDVGGGGVGAGGARFLPDPKTRPPPRLRCAAMADRLRSDVLHQSILKGCSDVSGEMPQVSTGWSYGPTKEALTLLGRRPDSPRAIMSSSHAGDSRLLQTSSTSASCHDLDSTPDGAQIS